MIKFLVMQTAQIQKDKLKIIEKILQIEDESIIESIKMILNPEDSEYVLSKDQKLILEETTAKYYSGEEPSFPLEEVKANARKNLNDKKA